MPWILGWPQAAHVDGRATAAIWLEASDLAVWPPPSELV